MALVETVRGPVPLEALGATLMHEHVYVLSTEILENYGNAFWDEDARIADAVDKLRELRNLGVSTIVDPTVIGLGRYIPRIERVNAHVDINIIAATGVYTYNELPLYFHFRGKEPMEDYFVRDITEGIAGGNVKAAFLKCAIDVQGLRPGVERAMRAVARAHCATGAPITVHTHAHSKSGVVAQSVFREEGVDLTKVVIAHSGDSTDIAYLTELADAGSYLGMDRFGIDTLLPFDERVATVAELCRRGYAAKMVLSHDASCFIDWFDHRALARAMPKWNYTHIHNDVLPALRERGVTEAQIVTMLVENPKAYFSPKEASPAPLQT